MSPITEEMKRKIQEYIDNTSAEERQNFINSLKMPDAEDIKWAMIHFPDDMIKSE